MHRALPVAAITLQHKTTASDSGDHFDIRQQLREGRKVSKAQIKGYKVAQLREALQEEGLSTKGLKAELVERLYELVQTLSQEDKDPSGLLGLASTAERSAQAEDPSTSPEEPAQDDLRSHTLDAQSEALEEHEDATAVASTPTTASTGDSQHSAEAESNDLESEEDQLSSFPAVAIQQRPANNESVSEDSADSTAAAVSVRGAAQQGSRDPLRDLSIPDPVASKTGLAVTWLGTSSGAPTLKRNVSCIAVRLPSSTFLVDAGEGSCRQVEQAQIHAGRVKALFVTHLHGDHCFGIPGLLRSVSSAREGTPLASEAFRIFGPPGLRALVTSALAFDATPLCMPIAVTEWSIDPEAGHPLQPATDVPGAVGQVQFGRAGPDMSPGVEELIAKASKQNRYQRRRGFQLPEHDVDLIEGLTWTVPCDDGIIVTAAQLQHRLPCWGYVFREAGQPPLPDPAKLAASGATEEAVQSAIVQGPKAIVQLPSGEQVPVRSLVVPPVKGRKVVLLGDTCDSHAILSVGKSADVLSHEATFTADMYAKARIAQHSTAPMAGNFARQLGAQTLVLTHFSGRFTEFRGKGEEDALPRDIHALKMQAMHTFGSNKIFAASDFFTYQVPRVRKSPAAAPKGAKRPAEAAQEPERAAAMA
ncbi:g246 [Coccomyxa viridis]|uniref:G246 protein n=1 Tax=Coccomyxa viridis TaxID=1274662 RepID=A0ABP1FF91_9CHLO